jgi:hypothetical protein
MLLQALVVPGAFMRASICRRIRLRYPQRD